MLAWTPTRRRAHRSPSCATGWRARSRRWTMSGRCPSPASGAPLGARRRDPGRPARRALRLGPRSGRDLGDRRTAGAGARAGRPHRPGDPGCLPPAVGGHTVLAPVLGAVSAAPVYPAIAGSRGTALERAVLGALGWCWLLVARRRARGLVARLGLVDAAPQGWGQSTATRDERRAGAVDRPTGVARRRRIRRRRRAPGCRRARSAPRAWPARGAAVGRRAGGRASVSSPTVGSRVGRR